MTLQVNLLPVEHQLRAKRAARLKIWVALSTALIAAQVMSSMFLGLKAKQTRTALKAVAKMQAEEPALHSQQVVLTQEKCALKKQIALAERLRLKHRWSDTFAEVTAALPDTIMLTELASVSARQGDRGVRTGKTKSDVRRPGSRDAAADQRSAAQGLVIGGIARDHESVAHFLGVLDDRAQAGTCELETTSRQPFMDDHAVAFTIRTSW
jgi:Tfp pilus assembly protein PilN